MPDWFVHIDGRTTGPFPPAQVGQWLSNRQLPGTALFWPDGGAAWIPLSEAWPLLAAPQPVTPQPVSPPSSGAATDAGRRPAPQDHQDGPRDGLKDGLKDDGEVYPGQAPYTAPYTGEETGPLATHRALTAFTDRLSDFAGVERIRGFSLRELLSLATRRHSRDEIEQNFATGLPGFVPPLDKVESDWFKPWMFVRFYTSASLLFLAFVAMVKVFDNVNLLPGMIIVGSLVVPLAVLVFFFEANTPRNMSLFTLTHAFLVGGVVSLAITLVLVQAGANRASGTTPFTVGLLEEVGKLLAVYLITWRLPGRRYPWILNGMLFGAAVGAGFAAFESAGYALTGMLSSGQIDVNSSLNVIFLRGALAPFGHVVWTALAAGALWRVKRDRMLRPTMLVDLKVLRILGLVIALHIIWDMPAQLPLLGKYALLGLVAWVVVLGMIASGLKQIKATQISAAAGGPSVPLPTAAQPRIDLRQAGPRAVDLGSAAATPSGREAPRRRRIRPFIERRMTSHCPPPGTHIGCFPGDPTTRRRNT